MPASASSTKLTFDCVILAAGAGRRMGGIVKQFEMVKGAEIYQHAIAAFAKHEQCGQIVLVVPEADLDMLQQRHNNEPLIIVAGGQDRHHSVQAGLAALAGRQTPIIAIHDAARPFTPQKVIDDALAALAHGAKAVIPVLPVADTIKVIDQEQQHVLQTLDRNQLGRVQTPQFFDAGTLQHLHHKLQMDETRQNSIILDDASLAEEAGIEVAVIAGDEELAKLTWPSDLASLRTNNANSLSQGQTMTAEYRTGTGFDVHRFTEGTGPIMICGLAVPHDKALDAHSDGDVGIHALCDAIFGALCDGDIGSHFPPSDERWKDAASDQFLRYAVEKIAVAGAKLTHIDVTILCELPKIGPVRDDMRAKLSDITSLSIDRISVKATTTEKLGFTGRGEGIAAQAAATICFDKGASA